MPRYVALLRGIAPMNPNMRNERLRMVFEKLGFTHVKTVISSGNVLFESPEKNSRLLEEKIEHALPLELGFTSTTIIRSEAALRMLLREQPFKGYQHNERTYLTVTFLKHPRRHNNTPLPQGDGFTIVDAQDSTILSVVDLLATKTPNLMLLLERQLGKEMTTRTWKTVERIIKAWQ